MIRMKFVAQLSLSKRMDLCRVMGYVNSPKNTTLFRQGRTRAPEFPPQLNGQPSRPWLCPCTRARGTTQGLTLVHFSAQLEPCLTHKNTLHTLNTPLTWATQPLRATPIP